MDSILSSDHWYLLRTRQAKERSIYERLTGAGIPALLPLIKHRCRRWGRTCVLIEPLFPTYLFVKFKWRQQFRTITYTRGVRHIISAGTEPLPVQSSIIQRLEERCAEGPFEPPSRCYRSNEEVIIVGGPFKGLDAVFDQYMSGTRRVAILLSAVSCGTVRVVLPADSIAPVGSFDS